VGFFDRLRVGLSRTKQQIVSRFDEIVQQADAGEQRTRPVDVDTIEALEELLVSADVGIAATERIVNAVKTRSRRGESLRDLVKDEIRRVFDSVEEPSSNGHVPHVTLVVGVNGTGKTTTIGKLAAQLAREGKKVMLAAGDTFRAAAIDQLKIWGERTGATVVARAVNSDAAGLVFDALTQARADHADVLLIDTAGRLQNKEGLMEELAKIIRVLRKVDPTTPHDVLLVLDATTGQNALEQVEVFRERAGVTGLVMTKLDGTARGGILVAISAKHGLPVCAIGIGEGVDDLQPFDPSEFAEAIAGG
jgi:fused signal recognition particle receptor